MKNFNYLTLEVLSTEELASVKGGYGIPQPIIVPDFSAGYGIPQPIIVPDFSVGYGIPQPIVVPD